MKGCFRAPILHDSLKNHQIPANHPPICLIYTSSLQQSGRPFYFVKETAYRCYKHNQEINGRGESRRASVDEPLLRRLSVVSFGQKRTEPSQKNCFSKMAPSPLTPLPKLAHLINPRGTISFFRRPFHTTLHTSPQSLSPGFCRDVRNAS